MPSPLQTPPTPPPPQPPAPPGAPAPALTPAVAGPAVVPADAGAASGVTVARAAPRTAQDIAGLREQRNELSTQLVSAQGRRREVARALERADNPANRAGLEKRLGVLDQRIAQIEADMAETGRLITNASPALLARSDRFNVSFGDRGPPAGAVAIVFILFVLFPMVLFIGRSARRRGAVTRPDPAQREAVERLARLEQAVDAIAVEVERVSEGQRFVTRLLAESREVPAIGGAQNTLDLVPRQG